MELARLFRKSMGSTKKILWRMAPQESLTDGGQPPGRSLTGKNFMPVNQALHNAISNLHATTRKSNVFNFISACYTLFFE